MRNSILTACLALAACSSNPPKSNLAVDGASASASIKSMSDAVSGLSGDNAESVATAMLAFTSAGETLIAPRSMTGRAVESMPLVPKAWPRALSENVTGTATCSNSSCTYDHYGDSSPSGSYELNGTISWSNNSISVHLTFDITGASFTYHWQIDGDVSWSPTSIDGSMESMGTLSANGDSATWDLTVDYQHIGLDGSGCPSSGSLAISVDVMSSGPSAPGNYSGSADVSFGPVCGDFTVN